jgi:hypothetical protein
VAKFEWEHSRRGDDEEEEDDEAEDASAGQTTRPTSCAWKKRRIEAEVERFEELVETYMRTELVLDRIPPTQRQAMRLTITSGGCTYDGSLEELRQSNDHLDLWFKAGSPSSYGDVRTQTTVLNKDVRDAVEFTAEEFSVSPELIAYVETVWATHFFPTKVRAEAYKINVYGPGGHFQPHKDTPAKDLVGTVLLGLGDTSDGHLKLEADTSKARVGCVAAFFPSVVHSVAKVSQGYRATLALKVYRTEEEEACDDATVKSVADVLSKWPLPFGLLLRHEYSVGTRAMSAVDAVLVQAAKLLPRTEVHTLPVVTTLKTSRDVGDDVGDSSPTVSSRVYPLTDFHVDQLLKKPPTKAEPAWLAKVKSLSSGDGLPFFTLSPLSTWGLTWRCQFDEGAEFTGNHSRPEEEDSVYLHHAVVVLPEA